MTGTVAELLEVLPDVCRSIAISREEPTAAVDVQAAIQFPQNGSPAEGGASNYVQASGQLSNSRQRRSDVALLWKVDALPARVE
jgi:hypothetical protein